MSLCVCFVIYFEAVEYEEFFSLVWGRLNESAWCKIFIEYHLIVFYEMDFIAI